MPTPIRLRPGVHAAPVAGGLLITGRGAARLVRGEAAVLDAVWLRMLPAFHRGTDPGHLAGLSPVAAAIIEALEALGLLLPIDPDWPDDPTLEYLASVADEPLAAWTRFQALKVAIVGDGPAALAAERTLLAFGLPASQITHTDPDVVVTTDAKSSIPAGVAWIGIAACGERVVVGPLRTAEGGLSLDDAMAMLAAEPAPTSPVAARLAGNLAAADVLAFGAGLTDGYRWRASVVHVDGARVERVLVTTPGAQPLSAHDQAIGNGFGATGPLGAPTAVAEVTGPFEAAQIRLLDGRSVLAFGTDADDAAANASVAAARSLVPERIEGLWHADGTAVAEAANVVTVAGTSPEGFRRDALRRILSTGLSGLDCFTEPRIIAVPDLSAALAVDLGFFERLRIPLTVTVREARDVPFVIATVATYGRTLSFDCGAEEEAALVGALHQAMLVVQSGADPCPTYADGEKWDPGPVQDAFTATGRPLLTGRWTGAPADALGAIVGWAALGTTEGDGR